LDVSAGVLCAAVLRVMEMMLVFVAAAFSVLNRLNDNIGRLSITHYSLLITHYLLLITHYS